jgi:hypothetical protein
MILDETTGRVTIPCLLSPDFKKPIGLHQPAREDILSDLHEIEEATREEG